MQVEVRDFLQYVRDMSPKDKYRIFQGDPFRLTFGLLTHYFTDRFPERSPELLDLLDLLEDEPAIERILRLAVDNAKGE